MNPQTETKHLGWLELQPSTPRIQRPILKWIARWLLRLCGWRVDMRSLPDEPRLIMIAAPHTSNWDMVFVLFTVFATGLEFHWLAKHTMFKGPMGAFLRAMGAIPINRSAPGGVIRETVDAFKREPQLIIAMAPEGTRSHTKKWKRGFYSMAQAAKVPAVVAYVDYGRKQVGTGPSFHPSGDWDADMKPIFDFYRGIKAKHPENFVLEQ